MSEGSKEGCVAVAIGYKDGERAHRERDGHELL